MDKESIKKIEDEYEKQLQVFAQNRADGIATLSAFLSSSINEKILLGGRLLQGIVKYDFWKVFTEELETLRRQGALRDDYLQTNIQRLSLLELMKYLDQDIPEEEIFEAMKHIFLKIASESTNEKEHILLYQLMQVCKKISSGEMLVLSACYRMMKAETGKKLQEQGVVSVGEWLNAVEKEAGIIGGLVELYEDKLVELKLISDRKYSDRSGIHSPGALRLTSLGITLCEKLSKDGL